MLSSDDVARVGRSVEFEFVAAEMIEPMFSQSTWTMVQRELAFRLASMLLLQSIFARELERLLELELEQAQEPLKLVKIPVQALALELVLIRPLVCSQWSQPEPLILSIQRLGLAQQLVVVSLKRLVCSQFHRCDHQQPARIGLHYFVEQQ